MVGRARGVKRRIEQGVHRFGGARGFVCTILSGVFETLVPAVAKRGR